MTFLPKNIHVLVIDDKIGNQKFEFQKHTQYFDHRLKCHLKKKLGTIFIGEVFIHYLDAPGKLESILVGSDYTKVIPVDVFLLDINFERLGEEGSEEAFSSLTSSFLYEGREYAGIAIYKYLKNYISYGISTIPIIIISGDKDLKNITPKVRGNGYNFDSPNIKEKKINKYKSFLKTYFVDGKFNDVFVYKSDSVEENDWIKETAIKLKKVLNDYFNKDTEIEQRAEHLINRLQNEYFFLRKLEIDMDIDANEDRFTFIKQIVYPKYELKLEAKKDENAIALELNYNTKKFIGKLLFTHDKNFVKNITFKLAIPVEVGENWLNDIHNIFNVLNDPNTNNAQKFVSPSLWEDITQNSYYGNMFKKASYMIVDKEKCILCMECQTSCKKDAIENLNRIIYINSSKCVMCAECLKKCSKNTGAIKKIKTTINKDRIHFGGKTFENRIFLAATPATAFSGINKDSIIDAYINKLFHLYSQTEAGGIILKTVYMEENDRSDSAPFSIDNIRELNVARCYSIPKKDGPLSTLYNTGKTANENIDYSLLKTLLRKIIHTDIPKKKIGKRKKVIFSKDKFLKSIILSLGSHSYDNKLWEKYFEEVFEEDLKTINDKFEFIEINARHSMRKISQVCSAKEFDDALNPFIFGVDEYFISPDLSNYTGFWSKFEEWIETIHKLGIKHEKFLMIKLPYRSDLNMLIYIIRRVVKKANEEKYEKKYNSSTKEKRRGITAISAINTIKSPYPRKHLKLHNEKGLISDFNKLPQTSGEGLTQLRNITLYTLSNICGNFSNEIDGLDLSASGGIMSEDDVYQCITLGAKTVQISSWYLIEGNKIRMDKTPEGEGDDSNFYFDTMKLGKIPRRRIKFIPERCLNCGKCTNTYYCDAIVNKFTKGEVINKQLVPNSPIINYDFCSGCGMCASVCDSKALILEYENALKEKDDDNFDGAPVPKSALLNDKECPICKNNKNHIFVYPLETVVEIDNDEKESQHWRQYYYCSNCSIMFSRKRENGNNGYMIEALINTDIIIDNNNYYLSPYDKNIKIKISNGISVERNEVTSHIPHLINVGFKKESEEDYIKIKNITNSNVKIINKTKKKRIYHSIHGDRKDIHIYNKPIKIILS